MALTITVAEKTSGVLIITPSGSINSSSCKSFEVKVRDILTGAPGVLVFDFKSVDFMCSAGLQVILDANKTLQEHGKIIVLMNLQPHIMQIFEILNISNLMQMCVNENELDQYISKIGEI